MPYWPLFFVIKHMLRLWQTFIVSYSVEYLGHFYDRFFLQILFALLNFKRRQIKISTIYYLIFSGKTDGEDVGVSRRSRGHPYCHDKGFGEDISNNRYCYVDSKSMLLNMYSTNWQPLPLS